MSRNIKNIFYFLSLSLVFIGSISFAQEHSSNVKESKTAQEGDKKCPAPLPKPSAVSFPRAQSNAKEDLDKNKEVTDISTQIVNELFFSTPDSLFNFLKLVYGNIAGAIEKYRNEKNLDEQTIFLVFKGGNVLRMVANRIFNILPEEASELLKGFYGEFFNRSDNDFSVYIDNKRLGKLSYDEVYRDINKVIFDELNVIRDTLTKDPKKYFNFMQLDQDNASEELNKYLTKLNEIEAIKDPKSPWHDVKFTQLQLLDYRANKDYKCPYGGGAYDYSFEAKGNKLVGKPISSEPHYLTNSDNKTVEFPWGSDPNKKTKFSLMRIKASFEDTYEKDDKVAKKVFGGELVDVTVVHRDDDNARDLLNRFAQNVSEYTISSDDLDDKFSLLAYSLGFLSHDMRSIIFETYDRPWNMGPKYPKRINRLFFLSAVELMASYGIGSPYIAEYIDFVRKNLIEPMKKFYPINDDSTKIAQNLEKSAIFLSREWTRMVQTNNFWLDFADLVKSRLLESVEDDDQESMEELLATIEKNLDIAYKLSTLPKSKIDTRKVYEVNINDLF